MIDKHKVNIFYTAPTAIRALMREGEAPVKKTIRANRCACWAAWASRSIPKRGCGIIDVVGEGRCPIVDTWWQTETGGILISPLPGATALKPGSATQPLFGIAAADSRCGRARCWKAPCSGNLVLTDSWPGQMRTVYGDHERFIDTYFKTYPGKYFTGDGCRRDEDGYYWITGRVDDVINVSGHRLGTAEIESALVANHQVAEAAVVGFPHDIKGQGIYAFVTLKTGVEPTRRAERRTETMGAQGFRRHRQAGCDSVRAGPAQNALGQNHAAHPAQDRRRRYFQSRRHFHAGRSRRGGRFGEEPEARCLGPRVFLHRLGHGDVLFGDTAGIVGGKRHLDLL